MAIHLAIDLLKPLNSMFGYRRRKTQASASGRVTPNLEKDLKIFYNTWSATRDWEVNSYIPVLYIDTG